ncbi:type II toxin-antitoxin system RelE/ParE family toxin [Candidatus Poribacteria bacterium]|nr:type II toxin-antitoxin system RelE/ParE family toxin [Candidatus Poribacteria bacterium]
MANRRRKRYTQGAAEDLAALRPFDRNPILDSIDEQLTFQPLQETRNKKVLIGLVPRWEYVPPPRELRVGKYRVFYDVDETTSVVVIRAVREKPADKRTEDIR